MGKITFYWYNDKKNKMERKVEKDIKAFNTHSAKKDLDFIIGKLMDSSYEDINNKNRLDMLRRFRKTISIIDNNTTNATIAMNNNCLSDMFCIFGYDLNEELANKILGAIETMGWYNKQKLSDGREVWKWDLKKLG